MKKLTFSLLFFSAIAWLWIGKMIGADGVLQNTSGTTTSGGTVAASSISGALSNSILELRDTPGGLYLSSYGTNKMTSFGTNVADMTTISNGTVTHVNGVVGTSINAGGAGNGDVPVVVYRTSTVLTLASSTAMSNIVQFSVPAGSLGTNKSLVVEMNGSYFQNTASTTNTTIQFLYGATTNFSGILSVPASVNPRAWWIRCTIRNINASNSQEFDFEMLTKEAGAATAGNGAWTIASALSGSGGGYGTSAEDSTAAKNFTFQVSFASAAAEANIYWKVKSVTAIIQ